MTQRDEDIFDSILNLENDLIDQGYDEGHAQGYREGLGEGVIVGILKGLEVGLELGFMRGCLGVWTLKHSQNLLDINERALKGLRRLQELLEGFTFDANRETIAEEIYNIRSKFKLVVSQLGLRDISFERALGVNEEPQRPKLKF